MSDLQIIEGMSQADYRAAEGVSQSTLKAFGDAATPLHFKNAKPKKATPDMEFGTVCHAAILEPEKLHSSYYLKPKEYPSKEKGKPDVMKPWSGNAKWCQEWVENHKDRPVMTHDDMALIPKIRDSVLQLSEFATALESGKTEVSFFKRDEEAGLMLKCRCDLIATDSAGGSWIFDPKKVQSGRATPEAFAASIADYGYYIQAASYLWITGSSNFVFVPFDDDGTSACQFRPDAEMLDLGFKEWRRLLKAYAHCVKENHWPGYPRGIQTISLPQYLKKKLTM